MAKLDPAGKIVSALPAGGPGPDHGEGIGVDSAGNLYVADTFTGTATFGATSLTSKGNYDIFVWRP